MSEPTYLRPIPIGDLTDSDEVRFWMKVRSGPNCWEWTSVKTRNGYGRFGINGRLPRAARISWVLHYGPIPAGFLVCHRCDNPGCVRPDHLFLGTPLENMKDMVRKGRSFSPSIKTYLRGEQNKCAKFTRETAIAAFNDVADGLPIEVAAKKYGVSNSTIGELVQGKSWRSVTGVEGVVYWKDRFNRNSRIEERT